MTPLLLAIPLIAAAPIPKDFKKESPPLDGAWQCTGIELQGRVLGNQNAVWRFDGESLTIEYQNGRAAAPRPIKVDAKAAPKEFQFGYTGAQPGIYEITGDTLVICLSQVQGIRPVDTNGGPNVIKYSFTRVKDK